MPSSILLCYASHDGQTRRIAQRLTRGIEAAGRTVTLFDLGEREPTMTDIAAADAVAVAAAIRYGYPLPAARRMLTRCRDALATKPLAMISVNLTARKPEKRSVAGSPYLRKWVQRSRLSPALAEAVAGMLDYPRYDWFDRTMIRLIMRITGGPTDPSLTVEFTDWEQVDALAAKIAALAARDGG
jgi:menaquinone-dependent protoporphyrinogen oxidase